MGKSKSEAFLSGTLCALMIGCSQKHENESMERMLSRFENGWISKTNYKGDSTIGTFPIHVKDLKFSAGESVYKRNSLEYCHLKYDISFEAGDSLQLEIGVCWNGQTRVDLIESRRKSVFDDGNENRFSPIFEFAFQNAGKKWGNGTIRVTASEVGAVASECNKLGFVFMHPKMPCNSQSGIMPVWFIQNAENVKLFNSLKSRYGKTKTKRKDCSVEPNGLDDFGAFLAKFFSDSTFQAGRVLFPFHERVSSIDPKTDGLFVTDTISIESKSKWIHIPIDAREKGSNFSVFTDTAERNQANIESKFRKVEFSKEETDFNLNLIFSLEKGKWILIRTEYFEP